MTDDRRWYIRLRFIWQGERQHTHVGPYTREVANRDLIGYANGFIFGITRVQPYTAIVVDRDAVPVEER